MYIANPIFDTVFKHLMENNRVARFFVETLIDMPVESIVVTPQEQTFFKIPPTIAESGLTDEEQKRVELLSILRYDFVAIVHTPEGHKKVLIEIQKAKNTIDLMRFRTYLGEQYKRKDMITGNGTQIEEALPIITIYLLGFKLAETDSAAIHVSRNYQDMITHKSLDVKSEFIECLTHDSYVVQIPRIEGKTRTRLEKMLSVFEQKDFLDANGILKNYRHEVDDDNIRQMVDILYHTGSDPKKRKEIEDEWRSNEWLEEFITKREIKIAQQKKIIEDKDKELENKDKELEEMRQKLKQAGLS